MSKRLSLSIPNRTNSAHYEELPGEDVGDVGDVGVESVSSSGIREEWNSRMRNRDQTRLNGWSSSSRSRESSSSPAMSTRSQRA